MFKSLHLRYKNKLFIILDSIAFLGLFCQSAVAEGSSLNLPMQVYCGSKWNTANGAYICNDTTIPKLKIKIPPTKGQLRAVDCYKDITKDGNPDDFNTAIWKTGWWLWQRQVRVLSETPEFYLPLPQGDRANCPVAVSVAAQDAGLFSGLVIYKQDSKLTDWLEYKCGDGEWSATSKGVATCRGLENIPISFRAKGNDVSIVDVVGEPCAILDKKELQKDTAFEGTYKVPSKWCVVSVSRDTLKKSDRSLFLLVGNPREKREIDSPTQVVDGDKRRVILPLGATVLGTEIYDGDKIAWRSGPRKDENFELPELTQFSTNAIACNTAYSDKYDSVSGSCYEMNSNKEVPYFFK